MGRSNPDKLRAALKEVQMQLKVHPYNSPAIQAAQEVIEEFRPLGNARTEEELEARELPSLVEVGRVIATGLVSFARLNRQRVKLEQRISKTESR